MWSSPRIEVLLLNIPNSKTRSKPKSRRCRIQDMFFTFYDITTLNSTYQAKLKARWSWDVYSAVFLFQALTSLGRLFRSWRWMFFEMWLFSQFFSHLLLVSVYIFLHCVCRISLLVVASWDAFCIPLRFAQEKCDNFKTAVFFLPPPSGFRSGGVGGEIFRQWMSRNSRCRPNGNKLLCRGGYIV